MGFWSWCGEAVTSAIKEAASKILVAATKIADATSKVADAVSGFRDFAMEHPRCFTVIAVSTVVCMTVVAVTAICRGSI
ncbi:hypothetical protein M3Y98_01206100 [Aphelenchoides besseyi]|nr:hypothetical protein M3Y98_01206100 [Aphelenchoides besseyi]